MQYRVDEIRACGLECKWSRNSKGAPIIVAKTDTKDRRGNFVWAAIDADVWERAKTLGVKRAFDEATAFVEFFSVPA